MEYPELNENISKIRKILEDYEKKSSGINESQISRIKEHLKELDSIIRITLEKEKNYRRIVENMQDIYYRADNEGNLIMASPAIEKVLGYRPDEMKGKNIASSFYENPEDREFLITQLRQKGEVKNYETNLLNKEGKAIPILASSHYIYDKSGKPLGIEGTLTDITERKKAEVALKESEEKYRSIIENGPTGIFIINDNFQFIFSNKKLSQILGYSVKEIEGMDFRHVLDEKSLDFVTERYKKRQRGEKLPSKYELGIIRKDGKHRQLELRVSTITTKENKINTIGQLLDITKQTAARETLRKNEEKLKESEEKYRSLTNQLPVGVYRTTIDGKFIYFNKKLADMLGYEEEELYKINIPDLYVEEKDRNSSIEYLKKHPRITQREIKLKTKQGNIIIINDHINTVLDEKGNIKYFDGVLEDITERKKTEKALKESEEKFRQLAQTTSTAIMVYQGEKWVYANPAAEKISGYSLDELKKMNYWEFVAPEHQEMIRNRGQKRQGKKDVPTGYEFKIIDKQGKTRWVYLEGSVMAYQGKPAGLISVMDITQMKETEEELKKRNEELQAAEEELVATNNALKESNINLEKQKKELEKAKIEAEKNEAKSKSLLAAIPDMIFVFDKAGRIVDYHTEKKEFLYTTPEKFLDKKVDEVLPPPIGSLTHEKIKNALHSRETQEYEYELIFKDKLFIFESRMVYLDKNHTLAIVRDITETKEAQKELIIAKEKAEESDRLKSAFLANMSHEIRTPINGIVGFTQLLRDQEYTKEEQKEFFEIIDLNSKQLLQIINDIIDISKIEANQLTIRMRSFKLNKLMDELYNSCQMELKQKSREHLTVYIKKALENGKDKIKTDLVRLKQILTNLLTNAIKFTEEGTIEFGYELINSDEFLFYVTDTGIGIPKDKQNLIFNHFRRAHESKASKFGGTGLGLSISKKLVEMIGGKLKVESEENAGSRFFFTIPVERDKTLVTHDEEDEEDETFNWKNLKILVVEDDPSSQRFIRETLKPTNAKTIICDEGKKAMKLFNQTSNLSIILMDIKLPDKDGLSLAKEIKKIKPDIPIIATTAYAMENDKKQAINHGCNEYLAKPLNKNNLLRTINKYLRK